MKYSAAHMESKQLWNRFDDSQVRRDLILSSGFLAFASHLGFLRGVERSGIAPGALVGTSSGALTGALYAAGHSIDAIARLLTSAPPLRFLSPNWQPWSGLFAATPLLRLLRSELPARFEDLALPFGVGVMSLGAGEHQLLVSGSLPEAVLASCAIPRLLRPVVVAGTSYLDGGAADRLGVAAWRHWRPVQHGVLHRIERSMGREQQRGVEGVLVVNSPRSHNSLLRLRDFDHELDAACERTRRQLQS